MQNQAFNRRFSDLYKQQLPLDRGSEPKKMMVTFCGVPGSGKTTLAKRLAQDLHCHRISNDEVRELLQKKGQPLDGIQIGPITRITVEDILEENPNKLVIVDSSIDRQWPAFFDTAKQMGAATWVIRLNCSPGEIHDRLQARGRDDEYIARHAIFFEQFEACKRQVTADLELEVDYSYADVLNYIRQKLATLE